MKKKLLLWISLIAVAVVAISVGSFAYTAMTGTSTITITGGGTEFATVTASGYSWSASPVGGGQIGAVSAGNLYSVARDSDYTGDLVFTIIATNTDELNTHYVYLNLQIKVLDSLGAEVVTSWLTIEEATVELIVPAASSGPFIVKVSDGTYKTELGVNPTTSPTFYIRVRQK